MEITQRDSNCNLLDYSVKLSDQFRNRYDIDLRKKKGQYFTNVKVATFMADLININRKEIKLLDPGAGTGLLSAAVCNRIILESKNKIKLIIDCYENDSSVMPYLKAILDECKTELINCGHEMEYTIYESNFISINAKIDDYQKNNVNVTLYDAVISNPPYYKLYKTSPEFLLVEDLDLSPPNIYALFMFFAAKMLKNDGEMVFIVPRSFCSGLYYKKIRRWLIKNLYIERIHLFESRKSVFDDDEVLQENIIFKAMNTMNQKHVNSIVSHSHDKSFKDYKTIEVLFSDIVFSNNGDSYIRIPTSEKELEIIRLIDGWKNTLNKLGLEISTGPVVDFRTKENLKIKLDDESVPLLWMHNLKDLSVVWPVSNKKKEQAIALNDKTKSILVPVKNYVFLKRFTSKEQKHRLDSAVLLKSDFDKFDYLGIENHLNYIYKKDGELSKYESYGIAAIFKNTIIDSYFRALNGNTQVNTSEIRNLPLPSLEKIEEIGRNILNNHSKAGIEIDKIILKILNIENDLME